MKEINRREFVKTSAVATSAPYVLPRTDARTDAVRVGVVGLRGRGQDHLTGFHALPGVEVTAICDVDDEVIAGVVQIRRRGFRGGRRVGFRRGFRRARVRGFRVRRGFRRARRHRIRVYYGGPIVYGYRYRRGCGWRRYRRCVNWRYY